MFYNVFIDELIIFAVVNAGLIFKQDDWWSGLKRDDSNSLKVLQSFGGKMISNLYLQKPKKMQEIQQLSQSYSNN